MRTIYILLAALLSGLLFGIGALVSGMANPAKVLSFFDIAGNWDPSLALVMASALAVTLIGYRILFKRSAPMLSTEYVLPVRVDIDRPLILGAMIFGIGWGLGGLCPGPAVSAVLIGGPAVATFMVAMVVGVSGAKIFGRLLTKAAAAH